MTANRMLRRRGADVSARGRSVTPAALRVMARTERNVVRICPCGAVDIATVGQLREQIEQSTSTGAKHVVLDLTYATFLDSSGLRLLFEADAAARGEGWEFALIGGPAHVQRVFDLTGARARLPFLTASQLSALLTAPGDAAGVTNAYPGRTQGR
jgi:anti-anti-sigma factor